MSGRESVRFHPLLVWSGDVAAWSPRLLRVVTFDVNLVASMRFYERRREGLILPPLFFF